MILLVHVSAYVQYVRFHLPCAYIHYLWTNKNFLGTFLNSAMSRISPVLKLSLDNSGLSGCPVTYLPGYLATPLSNCEVTELPGYLTA